MADRLEEFRTSRERMNARILEAGNLGQLSMGILLGGLLASGLMKGSGLPIGRFAAPMPRSRC